MTLPAAAARAHADIESIDYLAVRRRPGCGKAPAALWSQQQIRSETNCYQWDRETDGRTDNRYIDPALITIRAASTEVSAVAN